MHTGLERLGHNIRELPWGSMSPDLNVIHVEHLWRDKLNRRVKRQPVNPGNIQQQPMDQEWRNITQAFNYGL